MTMKIRYFHSTLALVLVSLILTACASLPTPSPRPERWAKAVSSKHLQNLYEVDPGKVYRSAQPDNNSVPSLQALGIKTVLDLRYHHNDQALLKHSNIQADSLSMLAHDISVKELTDALRKIRHAKKPVLIHCQHGADRTGAVIAAYRIIEQGWSKNEAIKEMLYGGYGHHYLLFPNIKKTLEEMDVNLIKKSLSTNLENIIN